MVLLAVLAPVVLHPATRVLSLFESDLPRLFFPQKWFGLQQLREGHLPLWNPGIYGGAPFLGDFQSALLYPPNLLFFLLPLPAAFNLSFLLHLWLGGLFMSLWAASRGLGRLSCFLAGVVYMFAGPFFLHLFAGHLPQVCTLAWVPLIFLCLDRGALEGKGRWVLAGAGALALQALAGFPQFFLYTALLAGLYLLLNLPASAHRKRALLYFGAMVLGSAALAAAQWGAGFAAVGETLRGQDLPAEFAGSYSLPPENLLTLLFPDLFERFGDFKVGRAGAFWETTLFTGSLALLLACIGAWRTPGRGKKILLLTLGAAWLLAMGAYTPLFSLVYRWLPEAGHIRGPSKFIGVASAFAALLAAMGLDALSKAKPGERTGIAPYPLAAGGLLAVLGLLGFLLPPARGIEKIAGLSGGILSLQDGNWGSAQSHAAGDLLVSGCLFLAAGFLLKFLRDGRRLVRLLAVLCVGEMALFASTHLASFDWRRLEAQRAAIGSLLRENPGSYRVLSNLGDRVETAGGADAWGCDPFIPWRYYQFMAFTQRTDERGFLPMAGNNLHFGVVSGLFRLLNCRYLLADSEDRLRVEELAWKPLPRARLVGEWEKALDKDGLFRRMAGPGFDLWDRVLVEEDPGFAPYRPARPGQVEVKDLSSDEMEVRADLPQPALLVLDETYTPGWEALPYPDGDQRAFRVIPADYILRAVPLSAGRQHFRLRYRPRAFVICLWISALSWPLFLGAAVWALRQKNGGQATIVL